ncbi:MAG: recombinase family protein [Bacillota bacterium]
MPKGKGIVGTTGFLPARQGQPATPQPKVVLYARVSSEEQREKQTIQNQVDFYRKFCDLHQIIDGGLYADDGVTGTLPLEERPEGIRLLEDAKAKKFDQVLLYRLDRIGRDPRIILNAVHELQETGVNVKSMTEPFETGTVYGEFMMSILAGVAGLERGVFLERSALGTARAARDGKWLGGIVPYGYRVAEDGHLEVSEAPLEGVNMTEADVVRLIYDCVAERGWSTVKVADHLNALGIPTAYGKDGRLVKRGQRQEHTANIWRPGRIRNMLISPTYRGEHFYGQRTAKKRDLIPRQVPAIVEGSTWNKAQEVMRDNALEVMRNVKRRYLLRGLVTCDLCGLHYGGTSYKGPGGKLKAYYVCGGKTAYRGPLQGKCTNSNVPAEWLEETVWQDLLGFIRDPGDVLEGLRASLAANESTARDLAADEARLGAALAGKEAERQRVMSLYRKGFARMDDVEKQLQDLDREESALRNELEGLVSAEAEKEDILTRFDSAEALLASLQASVAVEVSWEKKREIAKLLVKEIRVKPPGEGEKKPLIEITYLFSQVTLHRGMGSLPQPARTCSGSGASPATG